MKNNNAAADLTPASVALFISLAKEAGDWSGTPLIDISKEERGNLTQLKRAGLLTTTRDSDRNMFANFSDAGIKLASENGIKIPKWC